MTDTLTYSFAQSAAPADGNYAAILHGSLITDAATQSLGLIGSDGVSGHDWVDDLFFRSSDFNHDRLTNSADLQIVLASFNTTGKTFSQGDSNYDGNVNSADLMDVLFDLNTILPQLGSPGTPTLTAASGGSVQISWPASTDTTVTSYDVYRSDSSGNAQLSASGLTTTTFTDTTASIGSTYAYAVVGRDANGDSSYPSAELVVTPSTATINPIANQSVAEGGTLTVSTGFSDPNSASTHTAQVVWGDGVTTPATVSESGGIGTVSFTRSNFQNEPATATVILTDQSGQVAAAQFNVTVVPNDPANLTATAGSDNSITLTWTNQSAVLSDYQIQVLGSEDSPDEWSYFDEVTPVAQVGGAMTYTATGLEADQSYSFQVVGENSVTQTNPSNTASATTSPVAPPGALNATVVSSSEIDLSWQANETDATGYEVDWSSDGTNFSPLANVDSGTTTYNATGLTGSTTYSFRVEAVDDAGQSDPSSVAAAQTAPDAPTGLSAQPQRNGQILLGWPEAVPNEQFIIQRSIDGNSWSSIANVIGGAFVGPQSYFDTNASLGTTYYYRVLATDSTITSGPSQVVTACLLPISPTGLAAAQTGPSQLTLTWNTPAYPNLLTGFTIEESTDGFNFSQLATVDASTTSYLTTLPGGSSVVTYRLSETNQGGHSGYSYTQFAPVTLVNFDDGSGSLQYPLVSFVAGSGGTATLFNTSTLGKGHSVGVSTTSQQSTLPALNVNFAAPVNDLTFTTVTDDDEVGASGQVQVFMQDGSEATVSMPGTSFTQEIDLSGYNGITKLVLTSSTDENEPPGGDDYGLLYDDFHFSVPTIASLTAYRTGNNLGVPVSASLQQRGDPTKYLMLVSDQTDPQTGVPFNTESTIPVLNDQPTLGADGKPLDPDLAKITLHRPPSGTTGTATISVSDPSAVALFDDNGQPLTQTSVNLASPSGYLGGLATGDVDVWVEGLHKSSDLTVKYACQDQSGNEFSRDTVHMQVADWTFIGKAGTPITSVEQDSVQLLQDDLTGDPQAPQAADSVYYKINLDGLTDLQFSSLNVQSDTNSSDVYSDNLVTTATGAQSADWGVIYNTPDANTDLTRQQVQTLQQLDDLNAVKDGDAQATFTTPTDSVSRSLQAQAPAYTAQDIYNSLTSDPNYGDKVQFVLDRMDWQNTGATYLKRFVLEPMNGSNWAACDYQIVPGTTSKGVLYINSAGTQDQIKQWALEDLRVWARDGILGLSQTVYKLPDGTTRVVTFQQPYFASIARQWARQFYWQIDPHAVPIGETFAPPAQGWPDPTKPGKLPAYTGMVNANAGPSAAIQSLASTLDFLYFFSADSDSNNAQYRWTEMYSAALQANTYSLAPRDSWHLSLPDIYLWVFSNRTSIFDPAQHAAFAVNIPSDTGGLNPDYWEASTRRKPDDSLLDVHDTPSSTVVRSDGVRTTVWPGEDQLHHFAGYFYLGAFIRANFLVSQFSAETKALTKTGDFPKANNPGDYDLGLVADDIGQAFQSSPGYTSDTGPTEILVWQDLTTTAPQAYQNDDRDIFPEP